MDDTGLAPELRRSILRVRILLADEPMALGILADLRLPPNPLVIVLEAVEKPGNLGAPPAAPRGLFRLFRPAAQPIRPAPIAAPRAAYRP